MGVIAVDVGGTFTDLVFFDSADGRVLIHKVASTPDDPSRGVLTGVGELCGRHDIHPETVTAVLHGTTVATNAVLEHKGARTGMLTNEGFRDILHIGRHQRPQHYSIMQEIPWQDRPLVQRRYRKTVPGRLIPPRGEELAPLDETAVREAVRSLKAEGVEAIAVCFLFSYLDPRHEMRAKAIVEEEFPDAFVVASSTVSRQFREFERFTTTAMCAFIGPKVRTYIARLDAGLAHAGISGDLRIMASNGGVATTAMAAEVPILTLLSGLAAGVLGGAWAGGLSARRDLITLDIGGTSADIGIVRDGQIGQASARDTWIAGFPLMLPMIDIHTIGAGGGSIAFIDPGGAFRVGPRSAGATPGPAAYGQGGSEPTVTDANLVLGRLDPEDFLGGQMRLDRGAAEAAIDALAGRLQLSREAAAEGVLTVINNNMANAIRSRTVQKGLDPRGMTLVAFGGAGPTHGAEIAELLGIREVVVPSYPGLTSAMGLLTTDLRYDALKTAFQVSGSVELARLDADLEELERTLRERFSQANVAEPDILLQRVSDLRYVGQGYELQVPLPDGRLDEAALDQVWAAFHTAHQAEYGHAFEGARIEMVNVRVIGRGRMPKLERPRHLGGATIGDARLGDRPCIFRVDRKLVPFETGFYRRELLPAGALIEGPAILLQTDTTTLVPPGWRALVEDSGNLLLSAKG